MDKKIELIKESLRKVIKEELSALQNSQEKPVETTDIQIVDDIKGDLNSIIKNFQVDLTKTGQQTPMNENQDSDFDIVEFYETAPGVCSINDIGDVANINVLTGTPNDGMVEVQWSLPQNADKVHIMYGEYGKPYEHALLNTDNDGHEVIGGLKNGVNYNFKVAGVRGCGVGNYSKEFDPMP
jgi:hypothetical protein